MTMYFYIAEKRIERRLGAKMAPIAVPDVEGLGEWAWIAEQPPYWYFVSKTVLPGVKEAPASYPNGVPIWDEGVLLQWLNGIPEEPDPLAGATDEEVLISAQKRGIIPVENP